MAPLLPQRRFSFARSQANARLVLFSAYACGPMLAFSSQWSDLMRARNRGFNALSVLVIAPLVAACASGARVEGMTAPPSPAAPIGPSSPAFGAVSLGTVIGGSETNPLWVSQVSNENFHAALAQSLAAHGLEARSGGGYRLNADLIGLDQPWIGLDITVTAKVRYTLTSPTGGVPRFDQTIETPYTARFGDNLYGVERFRLADEGAIRANIATAMEELTAALQTSPARGS